MLYSIYEQQQKLLERVIDDPYGTTTVNNTVDLNNHQSIYNNNTELNQNNLSNNQTNTLQSNSQPPLPQLPLINNSQNGLLNSIHLNNQTSQSTQLLLDQMSIQEMNLNNQLNNSLTMSCTANQLNQSLQPTQLPPQFQTTPLLNNLQDQNNMRWRDPDLREG